jgi:hypothetical protein
MLKAVGELPHLRLEAIHLGHSRMK